jgi:FkbM family methyltransferase
MNIEEAIEIAINCHRSGFFSEAERIYSEILRSNPGNKVFEFLISQVKGALHAEEFGTPAEKHILRSFKQQPSHYSSVPPFNANWMLEDLTPVQDFLSKNPFLILDIGARGGSLGELDNLTAWIRYFGFDADEEECRRIRSSPPPGFHSHEILPYFIGKADEQLDFHLYSNPGCSSRFKPHKQNCSLFNAIYEVAKTIQIQSKTLDQVVGLHGISSPDFIKLDTQGSELEILKASLSTLSNVMLVESEIEVVEIYDGQPLLGEFLQFMNHHGFELLYLNRVFSNRAGFAGRARGQVIFCDALFAKKESYHSQFSASSLAKHAILLANYGHLDIAYSIWNSRDEVRQLIPNFSVYFSSAVQSEQIQAMNSDKLLYWMLHQRKYNQIPMDSDRSWPIR